MRSDSNLCCLHWSAGKVMIKEANTAPRQTNWFLHLVPTSVKPGSKLRRVSHLSLWHITVWGQCRFRNRWWINLTAVHENTNSVRHVTCFLVVSGWNRFILQPSLQCERLSFSNYWERTGFRLLLHEKHHSTHWTHEETIQPVKTPAWCHETCRSGLMVQVT